MNAFWLENFLFPGQEMHRHKQNNKGDKHEVGKFRGCMMRLFGQEERKKK